MLSILDSMWLCSRALYILAPMDVMVIPCYFLANMRVPLLKEGEDVSLCPSVYCVLIIYCIAMSKQYVVEFPGLSYFWWYFIKLCSFSIFNSIKSSSCVNCPSLMSNCLLIILVVGSCVTFGAFLSKFLKCCFHSCIHSSWLVAFTACLLRLPCYPRLPIFNWVTNLIVRFCMYSVLLGIC